MALARRQKETLTIATVEVNSVGAKQAIRAMCVRRLQVSFAVNQGLSQRRGVRCYELNPEGWTPTCTNVLDETIVIIMHLNFQSPKP